MSRLYFGDSIRADETSILYLKRKLCILLFSPILFIFSTYVAFSFYIIFKFSFGISVYEIFPLFRGIRSLNLNPLMPGGNKKVTHT